MNGNVRGAGHGEEAASARAARVLRGVLSRGAPDRRRGFLGGCWQRLVGRRARQPDGSPLDRRAILILPSGAGWLFLLGLGGMLLGGLNYNSNLALLLTFVLGGVFAVGIPETYRNLAGVTVQVVPGPPVFAGQEASFLVQLRDPRGRSRRALAAGPRGAGARRTMAVFDLPEGYGQGALRLPTDRRGPVALGRVVVESRFPLELFRAWVPLACAATCLVYPRPAERPPAPEVPALEPAPGSPPAADGEDFAGVRAYRAGDPLGRIHWRASARSGRLLSKQFAGSGGGPLWLDWRQAPGADSEERLSVLCRWALDAARGPRPWGLRLPGTSVGPGRGEGHLHRCLTVLALWRPDR